MHNIEIYTLFMNKNQCEMCYMNIIIAHTQGFSQNDLQ